MPIDISSAKTAVDAFLRAFFAQKIQDASTIDASYARLWENARDVALCGGKRLRPYLTYVGYGAINDRITPVATAHELLHIALLMHDDIIDRDDTRHGQPNLHGRYLAIYGALEEASERQHFSYSAALLAGDLLISAAHSLVAASDFSEQAKVAADARLSRSIFEVAGGELMDTEASFMPDYYDPMVINRYKTASYSFVGPLLTGALLAGRSHADLQALERCGEQFGIAYQLRDDYLGVFGDEKSTGKSTCGDLREGKKTYLIEQYASLSNHSIGDLIAAGFGNAKASDETLQVLKNDIARSGAIEANAKTARRCLDEAYTACSSLSDETLRRGLHALLHKLEERDA